MIGKIIFSVIWLVLVVTYIIHFTRDVNRTEEYIKLSVKGVKPIRGW